MIKGFFGEYRWLSNFWYSKFKMHGLEYDTVEHYYQSQKSVHPDESEEIRLCGCPSKAKFLGRKVVDLDPTFMKNKVFIMRNAVECKFDQSLELRNRLIATGNQHLEEANTWGDTFWGTVDGRGFNHLGIILMETRAGLIMEHHFYGDRNYL